MENYKRNPNTNCIVCSKPIYKRPWELRKNKGNVFCSMNCYGLHNTKPQLVCPVCSKQYSRRFNRKTCSRSCANINRAGTKYHMNRPRDKVVHASSLKIRLITQRGGVCERCSFPKTDILIVHHKNRDRNNNSLENLELLCPNCHSEEHYLEKSWLKHYNIESFREKLLLREISVLSYSRRGVRAV